MSKQLFSSSIVCLLATVVSGVFLLTVSTTASADGPFDRFVPRGRLLRKLRDDLTGQRQPEPANPNARQQGKTPTPAVRPSGQRPGAQPTPAQRPPQQAQSREAQRPAAKSAQPRAGKAVPGFGMVVKLDKRENVVVTQVAPSGNAAEAGLRPGDVLVEAGGAKMASTEEYDEIAKVLGQGDQLEFTVARRGKEGKLMVQFGEAPELNEDDVQSAAPAGRANPQGQAQRQAQGQGYRGNYSFVPEAGQTSSGGLRSVLAQPARSTVQDRTNSRQTTYSTTPTVPPQHQDSGLQKTVFQQQLEIQRLQRELKQMQRGGLTGSGLSLDGPTQ